MNTYRICITVDQSLEVTTRFYKYDVDALRPLRAISHVLEMRHLAQFDNDEITITSQLHAKNIFPLNGKTIRKVAA